MQTATENVQAGSGASTGWGNFWGGVTDTVGGLFDIAAQYENYRQNRGSQQQQDAMVNSTTTDYNPAMTQNGLNTAPTGGAGGLKLNNDLLVTGGLLLVGGLVLVKLLK